MPLQGILLAVAAAAAVGSAVVSAEAARKTNKNVRNAILGSLDKQDAIDRKQREVVQQLLPDVDQDAQTKFLKGKGQEIEDSLAKTAQQNQSSRQTDIAIAGKVTGLDKQRRASKKESEQKYNARRYHLARFLAPNAVGTYIDPKLNASASKIREFGVQKGAEARIGQIDAQYQAQNSAGGLKGLATALSIVSAVAGIGAGFADPGTAVAGKATAKGSTAFQPGSMNNSLGFYRHAVDTGLAAAPPSMSSLGSLSSASNLGSGLGNAGSIFSLGSLTPGSSLSAPTYNTSIPSYPLANTGPGFTWENYQAPRRIGHTGPGLDPEYFRNISWSNSNRPIAFR